VRDGWTTDLEDGRVTLVAIDELEMESDKQQMMDGFEPSRVPHSRCATAANKSLTFTLPKEVSLFAEGDPKEAIARDVRRGSKVPWTRYTEQALHRRRRHSHAERKRRNPISRCTFSSENSQRIGRPPSFCRWPDKTAGV
jgi:hypothetical protein